MAELVVPALYLRLHPLLHLRRTLRLQEAEAQQEPPALATAYRTLLRKYATMDMSALQANTGAVEVATTPLLAAAIMAQSLLPRDPASVMDSFMLVQTTFATPISFVPRATIIAVEDVTFPPRTDVVMEL
jgi:hypothetical protein